jgi:hypothetical protein
MSMLAEFLKKNGATEADLEMMKPLLENTKFASSLEAEIAAKAEAERRATEATGKISEFESQRNQFEVKAQEAIAKEQELRNWWETAAAPQVEKIRQDALKEAERRAAAEARLAKAKELYGFEIPEDAPASVGGVPTSAAVTAPGGTPAPAAQPAFDTSKFVTSEVLSQQADLVGSAIAATQNLAFEHTRLFGYEKPIDFEGLRAKALAEKRPLREIWERDFNVADRRAQIQAAEDAKKQAEFDARLAAARQEGFEKGMSQSINPATRDAMPSKFPMTFTQRDATSGKPWETGNARSQDRLQKVVATLAKAGA